MQSAVAWPSAVLLTVMLSAFLSACAVPEPAPPTAPSGLADLLDRAAERALYDGLRAYDDGQYAAAEGALRKALQAELRSPRDRAAAHKLLAFITCTSERLADCEAAFRAARSADKGFELSRSESGHPVWGPVYRRVMAAP
jgi:Tfp pilus assembly protein PilF